MNVALLFKPFKEAIFSLNGVSYFYISYNWKTAFDRALLTDLNEKTIFLGTSRSLYGIHPSLLSENVKNFSMMAASQMQILELLKTLEKKEEELEKIILEVNPLSLSSRHVDVISTEERKSLLMYDDFDVRWPFKSFFSQHVPIFRYRHLIRNSVFSFFSNKNRGTLDEYNQWRKRFHINEFFMLENKRYKSSLLIELKPSELKRYKERFFGECLTMLKYGLGTKDIRSDLLEESIKIALRISEKVVLWSPPMTREVLEVTPTFYFDQIDKILSKYNLELKLETPKTWQTDGYFFDCIHLNKKGSSTLKPLIEKELLF